MTTFRPRQQHKIVETSASAKLLLRFYEKYATEYDGEYPEVKNPIALIDGLKDLCKKLSGGELPDAIAIYVMEKTLNPDDSLSKAQYVIIVRDEKAFKTSEETGYSVSLVYQPTRETESISFISENKVIWSPDTIENTQHANRTQYYLGFAYMVCENAPGFESELIPEMELTGADLLAIMTEGELPPELIDLEIPGVEAAEVHDEEQDNEYLNLFEEDDSSLSGSGADHETLPNEELDKAEEEYNDLSVDFEELFE